MGESSPPTACRLPPLSAAPQPTSSHLPCLSFPACSDARELWRPFRECDYRCCAMLRRRGRPPLAIHVPAAQTGIDQTLANEPQLVRCVAVPLCPAAVPPATCGLAPSPFSGPNAAAPLSTAALAAAKLASAAALAASASASAASLAPSTTAQQAAGGGSADGGRPLRHSWRALAAELQALASPARSSSSSGDSSQGLMALSGSAESSLACLALSGSGESSQGSLALSGSPSPASVLRTRAAALPPRPPLAPALARLDCASARWQKAKEQLLVAQAQPQPPPHPQPKQQQSGAQARVATPGAGALGSSCQPPEPWATARVPSVPMLPV